MADFSDIRLALQDAALFIVYRLELRADGKLDKIPSHPLTGDNIDPLDPREWMLPAEAGLWADQFNLSALPPHIRGYGTGVVISEDAVLANGRRLFALDIDNCRDGHGWAPHASAFLTKLAGAGVEVSVSGNGLHAYGTYSGERPTHGTRNRDYKLELYTKLRFIACTGIGATGDPLKDLTAELHALIGDYFPAHDDAEYGDELSQVPVPDWKGPEDDEELIARMLRSHSGASVFGKRAAFADLWQGSTAALAQAFPPQQHGDYDASAADQALANHLAFWTGSHGERMWRLMYRSQLVRPKWERPGYLHNTIQRACASRHVWYVDSRAVSACLHDACDGTLDCPMEPLLPTVALPADIISPQAPEVAALPAVAALPSTTAPPVPIALGDYLTAEQQEVLFKECVYVQDVNQIFMPQGYLLNAERFDTEFAGYTFAMTADGQKPAKKASEAFLFSQLHSFPKVKGAFFDPRVLPRTIVGQAPWTAINTYVPSIIVRRKGDVSPYLTHLYKLLPLGNDAQILLSYFAACVQYVGEKFQWWPLIQGVEGNGKTTLSYLLEYAIGARYTHWPKAAELGSKFNSAFYGKMLICCEDVHISEARGSLWETLKPMITGEKIEIEGKGIDKVTREVCFNGVMNSNHKNAIRKTANDRRIGSFFCAQQAKIDLVRDGLTKDYFKKLRAWRLGEGQQIVADYLLNYEIPDQWNPIKDCSTCPETTATAEAIVMGLGNAEQEILEAIQQRAAGFRGGWVSSSALGQLLAGIGKGASIPRNRRGELLEALGYMRHPGLPEGRSTVLDTDGTRPTLYIRPGVPGAELRDPEGILATYQAAQRAG